MADFENNHHLSAADVSHLTKNLTVELNRCCSHAVDVSYCFCLFYGLFPGIGILYTSLVVRNIVVNIDFLVHIIHLTFCQYERNRIYCDYSVLKQSEIAYVLASPVRPSVYNYVSEQCCTYVAKCHIESTWVSFVPDPGVFDAFPRVEYDDLFLAIFPPRTPADIGIRNMRLVDILDAYIEVRREADFWNMLLHLRGKSYIFVANICLYEFMSDCGWWDVLESSGACFLPEYELRNCMKNYSDLCKKKEFTENRRIVSVFIENHNLFGSLQPPVEGWDPVTQTQALAGSTPRVHGMIGTPWQGVDFFRSIARAKLSVPKHHENDVNYYELKDFIANADWERSGASSIGRVKWSYKDEKDPAYNRSGTFKARKNFVLDLFTVEEVASMCLDAYEHVDNVAIIKSELAKIRIAVASPIQLYLLECWLLSFAGSFYLNWEGSTLEEGPAEELLRNYTQWRSVLAGKFVLPFDYSEFDHQIRLDEVTEILKICHMWSQHTLIPYGQHGAQKAELIILRSIMNARLHDPPSHGHNVYPVCNGLLSGTRSTSIVGNAFNLIMWGMVEWFLSEHLKTRIDIDKEIRGDDLRLTHSNQFMLILIYYIYRALGAEANPSKFGLCRARGDFLRLDCTADDGMIGLPARVTPSAMQRKPWKAAAWLGEGRLTNTVENSANIVRRLPNYREWGYFNVLRRVLCRNWSRVSRIDIRYCAVPRLCGGLGLLPWNGQYMLGQSQVSFGPHMLEDLTIDLQVEVKTNYRVDKMNNIAAKYDIRLTDGEQKEFLRRTMLSKIANDDIPDLSAPVRYVYRQQLLRVTFRPTHIVREEMFEAEGIFCHFRPFLEGLKPAPNFYEQLDLFIGLDNSHPFGEYRNFSQEIRERLDIGRLKKQKVRDSLRPIPWVIDACRKLENRMQMKRHVALDWVTEGITLDEPYRLHSGLIARASAIVAKIVAKCEEYIKTPDFFSVLWYRASGFCIDAITKSEAYRVLFAY